MTSVPDRTPVATAAITGLEDSHARVLGDSLSRLTPRHVKVCCIDTTCEFVTQKHVFVGCSRVESL